MAEDQPQLNPPEPHPPGDGIEGAIPPPMPLPNVLAPKEKLDICLFTWSDPHLGHLILSAYFDEVTKLSKMMEQFLHLNS